MGIGLARRLCCRTCSLEQSCIDRNVESSTGLEVLSHHRLSVKVGEERSYKTMEKKDIVVTRRNVRKRDTVEGRRCY
jgi:hypothetical protein